MEDQKTDSPDKSSSTSKRISKIISKTRTDF